MTTWTGNELSKIGSADELQIASLRGDGTLNKPVIIWVVRLGDDLYIRSYKGHNGAWFRTALLRHAGHIWAGGVEKDVAYVEELDPHINDQIDSAYKSKYKSLPQYVAPMLTADVRSTTLKLVPRSKDD